MKSPSLALQDIYQYYLSRSPFCELEPYLYTLQPQAGTGQIRRLTTFSGIEIVYSDIQYNQPLSTSFSSPGALVELQFAFQGQRHVMIEREEYTLPAGQGALILLQNFRACFYPPSQEPYISLTIGIPIPLFHYAVSRMETRHAVDFLSLLSGRSFKALTFELDERSLMMARALLLAMQERHRSPLLMEASALELVDRSFHHLFEGRRLPEGFSREDMRKLGLARSIIEDSLLDPPSLLELSRRVGLNDFKLKKGFKACYGTTVYEHLRQVRLESAMSLLREGDCSVTEAAVSVGYSNVSAFSQQFCRRYGLKPSAVKRLY